MKNLNGGVCENIARTAGLLSEDEEALTDAAERSGCIQVACDEVSIDLERFASLKTAVQKRVVRLAIANMAGLKDIESVHVQSILDLAEKGENGKRVDIKYGMYATIAYGQLMIGNHKEKGYNDVSMVFPGTGKFFFKNTMFECGAYSGKLVYRGGTEYFDADTISSTVFRFRKDGDKISPLGLGGTKRLSDYLSDKKVPLHKRDGLIVLAKGSEVFWVVGVGVSEKSKVKENSRIIRIKYQENE